MQNNNVLEYEEIKERLQHMPVEIQELFTYGIVHTTVREIDRLFLLGEDGAQQLEHEVILTLLLFLPLDTLRARLQESLQVDPDIAEEIEAYLQEELFSIVSTFVLGAQKYLRAEQQTADVQTQPTSVVSIAPGILPLRTMEGDVQRIHGYGAFRAADPSPEDTPVYRSEQQQLVPPPAYTDTSSTPKTP